MVKFTQINQVSENQLLIIIVLEGNVVKNKFIDISETIDPETLPQINFLINAALDGMDLTEINMATIHQMKEQAGR